jgi:hypothetical protein
MDYPGGPPDVIRIPPRAGGRHRYHQITSLKIKRRFARLRRPYRKVAAKE